MRELHPIATWRWWLLSIAHLLLHLADASLDLAFAFQHFVASHFTDNVFDRSFDLLANAFVLIAIHDRLQVK
jgi:hypothetical protein